MKIKNLGNRPKATSLVPRGAHNHSQSPSKMSTEGIGSPKREATPTTTPPISSIPQKRALDDDHQPAVSSPLNPDFKPAKPQDEAALARERAPRAKKESLKKRESKAGSLAPDASARATPDPKAATSQKSKKHEAPPAPTRYKLPPPKSTDFEPPRGPIFIPSHTKIAPDGTEIQFNETTDQ
jgi:COMPASS component BRE2